jgi:hypothetical protein
MRSRKNHAAKERGHLKNSEEIGGLEVSMKK